MGKIDYNLSQYFRLIRLYTNRFVGDCQIPLACDLFLKERGVELLEKNLYRNYIVHLDSMFNYGLVSPQVISGNIRKLNVIF